MRRKFLVVTSVILVFTLTLVSCATQDTPEVAQNENLVQTMVAMAFTQTEIAQLQQEQMSPTDTPEPTAEVVPSIDEPEETQTVEEDIEEEEEAILISHNIIPGEPGWVNKWFYDTDASKNAEGGFVTGGDDFVANLWERPFTESDMVYRPDLDINKTEISEDINFYYVTLFLNDTHPEDGFPGSYGIEIDTDRDGRGDYLVIVQNPTSSTWDIAGVSAYEDVNNDVGGLYVMRPNSSYSGNGYEHVLFSINELSDPDLAWARIDLKSSSVTIAFKKSLIGGSTTFVWGVWAAESLLDPSMLDLHDHFTQTEAGSPYQSHTTYPLKSINLVDNTCRETYGFVATQPISGLCTVPVQNSPTLQISAQTGSISGVAYDDINNNGIRDTSEPLTIYAGSLDAPITISLHQDSCSGPVLASTGEATFNFSGLVAGDYCVTISGGSTMTTPSAFSFYLPPGGSQYLEFGFYVIQ